MKTNPRQSVAKFLDIPVETIHDSDSDDDVVLLEDPFEEAPSRTSSSFPKSFLRKKEILSSPVVEVPLKKSKEEPLKEPVELPLKESNKNTPSPLEAKEKQKKQDFRKTMDPKLYTGDLQS